jgi:N-sulfoglucosamine sulfohydrolase
MFRCCFIFACLLVCPFALADDRPNVILFIADDMAWNDCGAYGHPHIQTPHLDQLARDGMRFDRAFLTCSSCSPSRSSIITGRYPHNTGAHQLHMPLPGEQVTFVEKLTESGYYTAAAGKWHLGNDTKPKFSHVNTKQFEWVKTVRERPRDKPFFFWFAFVDPHRPYEKNIIPRPHTPEDVIVPPFLPDNPETREDLAMYYDEITRLDGVVGNVRKELESQGIAEITMILFISDNGRPFPRCKTTVYDSGVRTPWIVAWPGKVAPGSVTGSLVSSNDIAPAILELAGIEPGSTFQGKSFLPILADSNATIRTHAISEHNWHDFEDHSRGIRSNRFRYVKNWYTDIPLSPPADAVRSPTYQKMVELYQAGELPEKYAVSFQVPRPAEEFYDLESDPFEMRNLIDDPQFREQIETHRAALMQWVADTGDRVPEQRRPDEFDLISGERLKSIPRNR